MRTATFHFSESGGVHIFALYVGVGVLQNDSPEMSTKKPFSLASGNRKRCRQTGSRQSTPLSTIRTRYRNSVSTPGATRTGKNQQNSLQKDPTSSIRTPIADAIFADAISETPTNVFVSKSFPRLCTGNTKIITYIKNSPGN